MDYLIPAWLIVIAALGAVGVYARWRYFAHSFSRLLFLLLYLALAMFPDIPIEWGRWFNRYFLLFLFLVDIASWKTYAGGK